MALSGVLYKRCRNELLRCSQFDSNAALRAVFVTDELAPFRDDLPEASSRAKRVDACLAYLLDKRLSDGQPVLPLFLEALRDLYLEGDSLRDALNSLVGEVRNALATEAAPHIPSIDDVFAHYKSGVRELLRRLGPDHPRYREALIYQQRLADNIARTRYGDTYTFRAERNEVLSRLDSLARATLGVKFNELCGQ